MWYTYDMGQSTDALLAYGYDLGGDEGGWKIREVADDEPQLAWYNPDDDGYGFIDQAERALLTAVGYDVDQPYQRSDAYRYELERAQAQVGATVIEYCSRKFPMYAIATKVITVTIGNIEHLDLHALTAEALGNDWELVLAIALRTLGITPIQPQPGWMLCSYWG